MIKSILRTIVPAGLRPYTMYQQLAADLRAGNKITGGPFKGMYIPFSDFEDDSIVPCALGTHELELHSALERLMAKPFKTFINVGARYGTYTVGFAWRCPTLKVIAYEMDEIWHPHIRTAAEHAGCLDRIEIRHMCEPANLQADLEANPDVLVFMDVEGYESELLDRAKVPGLAKATILVELHEFAVEGISDTVRKAFEGTHDIEAIASVPRTGAEYPDLSAIKRWHLRDYTFRMVHERPYNMQWYVMTPKG